jgi:hypothetical protein
MSASQTGTDYSSMNSDGASSRASQLKDDALGAVAGAKEAAAKAAESARASISDYASGTAQAFKEAVEDQKSAGAEAVGDLARAARGAAEGFQDRAPQLAGAVRTVADRVENVSNDIRDRPVNDLMASVTDFAGSRPWTFFACGILAGVVLSRLLSSSDR